MPSIPSIASPLRWFPLLLALLLWAGCGGPSLTPEEQAELDALPAPDRSAEGSKVPNPRHSSLDVEYSSPRLIANGTDHLDVRATLRNAANEPLPGLRVQVSLGPPPASPPEGERSTFFAVTDGDGKVRGTLASTRAGAFAITLLIQLHDGSELGFASRIEPAFHPGPAATLALLSPLPTTHVAGRLEVHLVVADAHGNPVPSEHPVTLSLGSAPAGATLAAVTQSTAAFDGEAHIEIQLTQAGQGYTLRASAPGLQTLESAPFEVVSADLARLAFLDQPTDVVAGELLPRVRVAQYDAYGNLATLRAGQVTLRVIPTTVPLLGETTAAFSGGIAEFSGLRIERAGEGYHLEGEAYGGWTPLSVPFRVLAADTAGAAVQAEPTPGRK